MIIGADPEVFLYNTKLNKFVSAVGIIPGTKENPFEIKELGKGFAIQTDNVLLEFNIPPTANSDSFVKCIELMRNYITQYIKNINPDLELRYMASAEFDSSELLSDQAKLFACDPDFNAYSLERNEAPDRTFCPNLRSSGFHIHINVEYTPKENLIKYLDAYIGLPSIIMDTDIKRRSLYGKAGAFRLQKWGVEYRVLSGAFMKDAKTLNWIFNQAYLAYTQFSASAELPPECDVIYAINNGNQELAKQLIKNYKLCAEYSVL